MNKLFLLAMIPFALIVQAKDATPTKIRTGVSNEYQNLQARYKIVPSTTKDTSIVTITLSAPTKGRTARKDIAQVKYYEGDEYMKINTLKLLPNKGLSGTKAIIYMGHDPDVPELSFDEYYWAWTGKKLAAISRTSSSSLPGERKGMQRLIFPTDPGGKPNMIIKQDIDIDLTQTPPKEISRKSVQHRWRGHSIDKQK